MQVSKQNETDAAATNRPTFRWLPWSIGALGFIVFALLLRELGAGDVWRALRGVGPWLPLLFALEVGRFGCELAGTSAVFGTVARAKLKWPLILRGQLLAQTFDVVLPAGRASAEASKAALFGPRIGVGEAIAAATVLQLAVLFCNAIWAFGGFVASLGVAMPDAVRFGLIAYAVAIGALVAAVVAFVASKLARRVFGRWAFANEALLRFAAIVRERPRSLLWAVLAQLSSRAFQAAQVAVLIGLLSGTNTLRVAVLGEAVHLVGAAMGDLVPAQVGATDGAFVLAAPSLGLQPQAALALALALHAVQLVTACVTGLLAGSIWWFSRTRDGRGAMYELPLHRHSGEREFS